jgi:hypothetical protein
MSIRRRAAALAISLLLHVSAAVLLVELLKSRRSCGSRVAAPASIPIDVRLVEAERPVINEAPVVGPKHSRRSGPSRVTQPAHQDQAAPSDTAPGPETPPAPAEPHQRDRGSDLSFDGLPESAKQRVDAVPNPEEDLERLLVPPSDQGGRRRTLPEVNASVEHQADAIENVRRGRAHPLHFDYLREARDLISPQAERLASELSLGASETLAGWARGYLDRLQDLRRGPPRDRPPTSEDPMGHRPDLLGAYGEAQTQAAAGAVGRVARVCLGVAPHHPVVVTLDRSSGNARLDELTMTSFRTVTANHPTTDDVRPGLACYVVAVGTYRMPPLPSLSLDWQNGRPRLLSPLQRMTKVTIDLESVDYGPPPGPPSLLRRPN